MKFKKVLATSLSLLFAAPLSTLAMKENVSNIEEKEDNKEIENLCPICYDFDLDDPKNEKSVVSLTCGHRYCAKCMADYFDSNERRPRFPGGLGKECPMCRKKGLPELHLSYRRISARELPGMEGLTEEEILDKLCNETLKDYKGLGTDCCGIMVSDFWSMRSDMIRYKGLPYTMKRDGELYIVIWPEVSLDIIKQKIKEHNKKTLSEEKKRWETITDAEVKEEIAKFRQYLNYLSVKNPYGWRDLQKNKRNKLVKDYIKKVKTVREKFNNKKMKDLINLYPKQS